MRHFINVISVSMKFLVLTLFTNLIFASVDPIVGNDRELGSYFDTNKRLELNSDIEAKFSKEYLITEYSKVLSIIKRTVRGKEVNFQNACEFELVNSVVSLSETSLNSYNEKELLFSMRSLNLIDDIVLEKLINVAKVDLTSKVRLKTTLNTSQKENVLAHAREIKKKKQKGCLIAEWKEFRTGIQKDLGQKFERLEIAAFYEIAQAGLISTRQFLIFSALAKDSKKFLGPDLTSYLKKKALVRKLFPLKVEQDFSEFITNKGNKKQKNSLRMGLYQRFEYHEMAIMSDLVNRFRKLLKSKRIEITAYDQDDVVVDKRELDPMERFRYAIKVWRVEKSLLEAGPLKGKFVSHKELIMAAFELGQIAAQEVDAISELEEIWNPQRKWHEKAWDWVKNFSSLLYIVTPPPYGFLPALGIMAIDSVLTKDDAQEITHGIF